MAEAGESGFNMIFQFKITLLGVKPPIWRRIQVPADYNFRLLHAAIQDSMGWTDSHVHYFSIKSPKTGKIINIGNVDTDKEFFVDNYGALLRGKTKVYCEKKKKLQKYFSSPKTEARYEYDMGDFWEHSVVLEEIRVADDGPYPRCIAGERACPPEDSGGVSGYENLVKILANSKHPEYKEKKEWLEWCKIGDYDPKVFYPDKVQFYHDKTSRRRPNVEIPCNVS